MLGMKAREFDGRHELLLRKYGITEFHAMMFGAGLIGRYLAKVAHCYAIAEFGVGNVTSFLTPHLLNPDLHDRGILPFIGVADATTKEPGLHNMAVTEWQAGDYRLIGARVQLFAQFDMPRYDILVGSQKGCPLPPWAEQM